MTLEEAREIADLSRPKLALLADIGVVTLLRMEQGQPVLEKTFLKVCKALQVDPKTITGVTIAPSYRPPRPDRRKGAQK